MLRAVGAMPGGSLWESGAASKASIQPVTAVAVQKDGSLLGYAT